MKMHKLRLKEDSSARVTNPGKTPKNYTPSMPKMAKIKAGKNPTTMLGKGNKNKPSGTLPRMGKPSASDPSPRNNSFHSR